MTEEEIRNQLVRYSRRTYDRKLVGGTGGNFSARVKGGRMLITASGVSLGDTSLDNLITVDIESGDWEPVGDYVPSKEYLYHAAILHRRTDIGSVLHVHPAYCTAYAVTGQDIPMVTDAGFKQDPIPLVPFAPSGSEELQEHVIRALEEHPKCKVMLLEKHGIVALGTQIMAAYNLADLMEELARIAHLATGL